MPPKEFGFLPAQSTKLLKGLREERIDLQEIQYYRGTYLATVFVPAPKTRSAWREWLRVFSSLGVMEETQARSKVAIARLISPTKPSVPEASHIRYANQITRSDGGSPMQEEATKNKTEDFRGKRHQKRKKENKTIEGRGSSIENGSAMGAGTAPAGIQWGSPGTA